MFDFIDALFNTERNDLKMFSLVRKNGDLQQM